VTVIDRQNEQQFSDPDLLSVPEAARRVGVHTDTLYRLCRMGQFPPAIQIGTRWRVSVPKLEQFLHGRVIHDNLRPQGFS